MSIKTPFSEFREEQMKQNIFDYFVSPNYFEQLCDAKPVLLVGARGTGKTTVLKALSFSSSTDKDNYLKNNDYFGVYYRVDLNVTNSFSGPSVNEEEWRRLFSYYFVSSIVLEILRQINMISPYFSFDKVFFDKYNQLFHTSNIKDLDSFIISVRNECRAIRSFINNPAYEQLPYIGDFNSILKELPEDISSAANNGLFSNKTFFYLIDEFEGLYDWQQQIILSFLKYSNHRFTFKICMRPEGLKSAETIGQEFISETDDFRTIDLNQIIESDPDNYYNYAKLVCDKRLELFDESSLSIENILETLSTDDELELIIDKNRDDIIDEFDRVFDSKLGNGQIDYFHNHLFDALLFNLVVKKQSKKTIDEILKIFDEKDTQYHSYVNNYKVAILYYLCKKYSKEKVYSGFKTLVYLSNGTIRYLLELCNAIFEYWFNDNSDIDFSSLNIDWKTQNAAIHSVSATRLRQISAVPYIGLNMRTFIIALGYIYITMHANNNIPKIEPNHFSIKSGTPNETLSNFLKECVVRGVLIKGKNTKAKTISLLSSDEYIYYLHPIYSPAFNISWRKKQKVEFTIEELLDLISNDTKRINAIEKRYKDSQAANTELLESEQLLLESF